MVYSFDGSYAGWLCVLSQTLGDEHPPDDVVFQQPRSGQLFSPEEAITTCEKRAAQMQEQLRHHLQSQQAGLLYAAFLSLNPSVPLLMCQWCWQQWQRLKSQPFHTTSTGEAILQQALAVRRERHRYLGLLRFQCNEQKVYIAQCQPRYFILPLLASHFQQRLANQAWMIIDQKRQLALSYLAGELSLKAITAQLCYKAHGSESEIQKLWQTFFSRVSIKERYNPKLQRQHIAQRFQAYLIEELR